jgi:hypothetical protein
VEEMCNNMDQNSENTCANFADEAEKCKKSSANFANLTHSNPEF